MTSLSLNELFRTGFSGGAFILAFWVTRREGIPELSTISVGAVTLLLAVALFTGSLIYGIHRAILYPLLYRNIIRRREATLESGLANGDTRSVPLSEMGPVEWKWDEARWNDRAPDGDGRTRPLVRWADQVHALYTVSWGLIGGLLLDWLWPGGTSWCPTCLPDYVAFVVLAIALGLLSVAYTSHQRYIDAEYRLLGFQETDGA